MTFLKSVTDVKYVKTNMSPQGVLSVEECATGIVNVTFDPATENGEFYQVQIPRKITADNIVGRN
jgi:hypothetical protein